MTDFHNGNKPPSCKCRSGDLCLCAYFKSDAGEVGSDEGADLAMASQTPIELCKELATALDMLLSLATDGRTRLPPKSELFTDMALNGARRALDKARIAGAWESIGFTE